MEEKDSSVNNDKEDIEKLYKKQSRFGNVYLVNKESGDVKKADFGYSFTTLFFGYWIPLFRKDYKLAGLMFLLVVLELLSVNYSFFQAVLATDNPMQVYGGDFTKLAGRLLMPSFTVSSIVFGFIVNKRYIKQLLSKGYVPKTEADRMIFEKKLKMPAE